MIRLAAFFILLASMMVPVAPAADDPQTGTISGSVVGSDGVGMADVPVKLFIAKDAKKQITLADPSPTPGRLPGMDPIAETKTAKDGTYKLENIAPGKYMVIAGDAAKGLARSPAAVEAGKNVEVKLTLRKRKMGLDARRKTTP